MFLYSSFSYFSLRLAVQEDLEEEKREEEELKRKKTKRKKIDWSAIHVLINKNFLSPLNEGLVACNSKAQSPFSTSAHVTSDSVLMERTISSEPITVKKTDMHNPSKTLENIDKFSVCPLFISTNESRIYNSERIEL